MSFDTLPGACGCLTNTENTTAMGGCFLGWNGAYQTFLYGERLIVNTICEQNVKQVFCNVAMFHQACHLAGGTNNTAVAQVVTGQLASAAYSGSLCCNMKHQYKNVTNDTGKLLSHCFNVVGNCIGADTSANYTFYANELKKSSGTFSIPHPDPSKRDIYLLEHSFVEAPTEGDNLYKFRIEASSCQATLELPSYYKFLNRNTHVHTTPIGHFGHAYGELTPDEKCILFQTTQDGEYDVILIGTRKDYQALETWRGPEKFSSTKNTKL